MPKRIMPLTDVKLASDPASVKKAQKQYIKVAVVAAGFRDHFHEDPQIGEMNYQ